MSNLTIHVGAITSTQVAVEQKKNSFQTGGTLTTSDIQNKANYNASSVSVSVGAGSSPLPGQGLSSTLSGAGMGKDSGSASSISCQLHRSRLLNYYHQRFGKQLLFFERS